MAEVKWIKITTDVFDDEKILLIESLPEADSIIVIWFKLLCLAGKQNNSGVFIMGNKIAYTDKMLATIFRRKEATVQFALQTFEQFGMIELVDGVITIPNWGKHQSLDAYEKKKQRDRERIAKKRAEQRLLLDKSPDVAEMSPDKSPDVASLEEDKNKKKNRIDKEEEKEEKEIKEKAQQIADLFNSLCPSFPQVKVLSNSIIQEITSSLNQFNDADIKAAFEAAESSDFLKGNNERKWIAPFDWLIKAENIAKVLNGNYDDKKGKKRKASYDINAILSEPEKPLVYVGNNEELRQRAEALKQSIAGN